MTYLSEGGPLVSPEGVPDPLVDIPASSAGREQVAELAGGCFWCVWAVYHETLRENIVPTPSPAAARAIAVELVDPVAVLVGFVRPAAILTTPPNTGCNRRGPTSTGRHRITHCRRQSRAADGRAQPTRLWLRAGFCLGSMAYDPRTLYHQSGRERREPTPTPWSEA
jgi:hypothetical protein